MSRFRHLPLIAAVVCGAAFAQPAQQPDAEIQRAATAQKQPLLDTIKELVSIETGTRDLDGLAQASELIANRLRDAGATVTFIEPSEATTYRMADTPEKIGRIVQGVFKGKGTKRILLIAHMDTVYQRGMAAKQPFRMDGNKAYGLGIADDKQGIAVILHGIAVLKAMNFTDYGTLTVMINGDEEISSPGSRYFITKAGSEHDAVLSFEPSRMESDKLSLVTAGIGAVEIRVEGRASHAGIAPERGINALYELSHQVLQARDLSNPQFGLKLNWTISQAGTNRNVIPAHASAEADVRVLRVADYDRIEAIVRERAKTQLIPEAKVTVNFQRRRPPLEATDASRKLGAHAKAVYAEIGKTLVIDDQPDGAGDSAFAALQTRAPVIERFGLQGFGSHSNDAEYVLIDSIEPRLYLMARLIMDISRGKGM